jgi:hypothetical protein
MERRTDDGDDAQDDLDRPPPTMEQYDDAAIQQNERAGPDEAWMDDDDFRSLLLGNIGYSDPAGDEAFLNNDWEMAPLQEPEVANEITTDENFDPLEASTVRSLYESLSEVQSSLIQDSGTGSPTSDPKEEAENHGSSEENQQLFGNLKQESRNYFLTRSKLETSTYPLRAKSHPVDQQEDGDNLGKVPWEAPASLGQHSGLLEVPISKSSRKREASKNWDPDVKGKRTRETLELSPGAHINTESIPQEQTWNSESYPFSGDLEFSVPANPYPPSWEPQPSSLGLGQGYAFDLLASAYPDPSQHELYPHPGPEYQTQPAPEIPNTNIEQGPNSDSWDAFQVQTVPQRNGRIFRGQSRLVQSARSHNEANPRIQVHEYQRPGNPQLPQLPRWIADGQPPQRPDLSRPGPGGPGTWPGEWITLERDKTKYHDFPAAHERIPAGHPLKVYCYWFPNHLSHEGLDPFIDQGLGGHKIWNHLHPHAIDACRRDDGSLGNRPWNYLQQAMCRRREVREKEANEQGELENGRAEPSGQMKTNRGRRKFQPAPTTMATTPHSRNSQSQPRHPSELQTSLILPNTDQLGRRMARPFEAHSDRSGLNSHQMVPSERWWKNPLRIYTQRIWRLHWDREMGFAERPQGEQWAIAMTSLRQRFSTFVAFVWAESAPEVPDLDPMATLHAIYPQLSSREQSSFAAGEQHFCDASMAKFLRYLDTTLSSDEAEFRRAQGTGFASTWQVSEDAFGSQQEQLHGLPHPRYAILEPSGTTNAGFPFVQGVDGPDQARIDQFSTSAFQDNRPYGTTRLGQFQGISLDPTARRETSPSYNQPGL